MEEAYIGEHFVWNILHGIISFIQEKVGKASAALQKETTGRSVEHQRAGLLLNRHGNSILRLAYSYLHNSYDAEDILQDTLLQYMQKAPEFRDMEHEKAWLLRVAANLSKNRIRYKQVREADGLSDELVAEGREDLSFVWEAVKELPEKYRAVIHLFYYEGYQTAQIAKILARKETTVRSDLSRGRALLRQVLKEAYDFEEGV